jgi:hypothetical protein
MRESLIAEVDMHCVQGPHGLMLRVVTPGPYQGWHVHSDRSLRRAGWKYRGHVRGIDVDTGEHDYVLLVDKGGEKAPQGFTRLGELDELWPEITSISRLYRTAIEETQFTPDALDQAVLMAGDSRVLNPVWLLARGAALLEFRVLYADDLVGLGVLLSVKATAERRYYLLADRRPQGASSWVADVRRVSRVEARAWPPEARVVDLVRTFNKPQLTAGSKARTFLRRVPLRTV